MVVTQKLQQQNPKAIYFRCCSAMQLIWSLNINILEMMHFLPCENLRRWLCALSAELLLQGGVICLPTLLNRFWL